MLTAGEALDIPDLSDQSEGVADSSALDGSKQLGLLPVLDQGVAGLEVVGLALLEGSDVLDVCVDQVVDEVASDGAGESLAGHLDQQLSVVQAEGGLAVSGQDRGKGFGAGLDELVGKEMLLE